MNALFQDRIQAGRELGQALLRLGIEKPLLLALPRGGVPIAHQIAKDLGAGMDLLLVRKISMPGHPEFGIGAVSENGIQILDRQAVQMGEAGEIEIQGAILKAQKELTDQILKYRTQSVPLGMEGRTVVIVDDGLATGGTALAAILAAKEARAWRIILAVPVGEEETVKKLEHYADQVVCLHTPHPLHSVGMWYEDFSQVDDQEVTYLLQEARHFQDEQQEERGHHVHIPVSGGLEIKGDLTMPVNSCGLVVFAHGSGSSRHSIRNRAVAAHLQEQGLGTLLIDLLTEQEERDRHNVFDIDLLAKRLLKVNHWLQNNPMTQRVPIGYFGASTGAGAALVAAAQPDSPVQAIVSRGGRPDMAGSALEEVQAPTMLIIGGEDHIVLELNQLAADQLRCEMDVKIIPGATHLFEEPGALEEVAELSAQWFNRFLQDAKSGKKSVREQPAESHT